MRPSLVLALVLAFGSAAHGQGLSVTFNTTPAGGNYAPSNIVAVWIEDQAGVFQKTIGRWAGTRRQYLLAWNQKAGGNDVDAVSGATRSNHNNALTVSWDLKNKGGTTVPDGTYTIRMEVADANATQITQNNEGTFTFVKGTAPQMQPGLTNGGFNNVTINYSPTSACNNGVVDPGETCDPPGSCPATCAASGDACMPSTLVGNSATCTAACMPQAITACVNGDGCCAAGCDEASDTDCEPGGANDIDVVGGCSTRSAPATPLLALVCLGLLALVRRRSR